MIKFFSDSLTIKNKFQVNDATIIKKHLQYHFHSFCLSEIFLLWWFFYFPFILSAYATYTHVFFMESFPYITLSKKFSGKKINLVKWWMHTKSANLMKIVISIQIYISLPVFWQLFNPFYDELWCERVQKAISLLYDPVTSMEDCAIKMQL